MATVASLRGRHEFIETLYHDNEAGVKDVQTQALTKLLPLLEEELALSEVGVNRARAFLDDRVTVFRFCRRARFSVPVALKLLHATLSWRLTSSLLSTLSPVYSTQPLFFFHPHLLDKFGRPCAVLNLKHVRRTPDGELEGLKDFIRIGWEMGRRWLSDLSDLSDSEAGSGKGNGKGKGKEDSQGVKVQMVVIVDLEGAGMSNLEVELLPFFMDLLKNHFPGMVGAIFVLNYGWMYAGMWQLAKRVLPNTALERILFPSKDDLLEFFTEDHLLVEHGGKVTYTYTPSNPILAKYGRPSAPSLQSPSSSSSAYPSPAISRTTSSESLSGDNFITAPPTPRTSLTPILTNVGGGAAPGPLARRTSGLSMTTLRRRDSDATVVSGSTSNANSRRSSGANKRSRSESNSTVTEALRRVASFADLEERLLETGKMIASDDSSSEGSDDGDRGNDENPPAEDHLGLALTMSPSLSSLSVDREREDWREDAPESTGSEIRYGGRSGETSAMSSVVSSRVQSRNVSTSVSREVSPRRIGETFSTRAVRFSGTNHISPYNTANPYYGYPAFVPPTSLDPSGVPRPHFHRRRKRDLLRTLTYLAVLRFLALNRQIRRKLALLLAAILAVVGIRRNIAQRNGELANGRRVRWEETEKMDRNSRTSRWSWLVGILGIGGVQKEGERPLVSRRVVLVVLALFVLRMPFVATAFEATLVGVPKRIVGGIARAGGILVGSASTERKEGRKRDLVMKGVTMSLKGGRVGGTRDRIRGLMGR